jgi:adenylosuccinate synthase
MTRLQETVGIPVDLISTGPHRHETTVARPFRTVRIA